MWPIQGWIRHLWKVSQIPLDGKVSPAGQRVLPLCLSTGITIIGVWLLKRVQLSVGPQAIIGKDVGWLENDSGSDGLHSVWLPWFFGCGSATIGVCVWGDDILVLLLAIIGSYVCWFCDWSRVWLVTFGLPTVIFWVRQCNLRGYVFWMMISWCYFWQSLGDKFGFLWLIPGLIGHIWLCCRRFRGNWSPLPFTQLFS